MTYRVGPSKEAIEEATRQLREDASQGEILDLAEEIDAGWDSYEDPYEEEEEW